MKKETKTAGEELNALVEQKMKDKPELDYSAAFSEVQMDHPEAAARYSEEVGGKKKESNHSGYILDKLIEQKMKKRPGLTFSEAFKEVQIEYPETAAEYFATF